MARVTVEDCVQEIPNRFELVVLAAERTKNIASGAPLTIEPDNDKNPVIALREIATRSISVEALRAAKISGLQKNSMVDDAPEENLYAEAKESADAQGDHSFIGEDNMFSHDSLEELDLDIDFSDDITEDK